MSKFSFLDPRYNDLSANEAIRQVERDNLLYEQTEAINKLNKESSGSSGNYNVNNPSNIYVLWFIVLVVGGVITAVIDLSRITYKNGLDYIHVYVYIGILMLIMIFGILLKILNTVTNFFFSMHIKKITPETEKQIRTLQKNWDEIESKIKVEKIKLESLESKLRRSIMFENENSKDIEKQINNIQSNINNYEEEQIELENKIEILERKIY